MLICACASRRTELHPVVAMHAKSQFPAAVVADEVEVRPLLRIVNANVGKSKVKLVTRS